MIVDTTNPGSIDVIIVFNRPNTPDLQAKFDYILDTISELEADYDFEYENSERLG